MSSSLEAHRDHADFVTQWPLAEHRESLQDADVDPIHLQFWSRCLTVGRAGYSICPRISPGMQSAVWTLM